MAITRESDAVFVATALTLAANLATSTVKVDASWWPWLMWSLVGLLFVAAVVAQAVGGGAESVDDQDIRNAVRDLEQELIDAYAGQALRHGASPAQIEARFRSTRGRADR